MNIATSLNKNYVLYTAVMLYSLCVNQTEPITAYILHSELDDSDFQKIQKAVEQFPIEIKPIRIDTSIFDSRFPISTQWSLEAYYRLFLMELLPQDVDRILYIDVDIIINKSLSELYHVDFDGLELIACADMCGVPATEYLNAKQQQMFADKLQNGYQYFNSGFLLLNIEELRKKYTFDYYVEVMQRDWNFEMLAPDQDILNYVHGDKTGYVDYGVFDLFARVAHTYGITYEEVKQQTAVVHFAGDKPWQTSNYHFDIEQIWWGYAKQTCYYQELLEQFMELSITDQMVEQRIESEKDRCRRLIEINNKLLGK